MKVLIAGLASEKGFKLSQFLTNKGVEICGIDNRPGVGMGKTEYKEGIFNLNPRHRDSMWLMLEMMNPDVVIYCATYGEGQHGDYVPFLNILLSGIKKRIAKFVLVINENLPINTPMTLRGVETFAMVSAIRVMADEHKFEYIVINDQDNLLKEVKKFLLKEEGEIL